MKWFEHTPLVCLAPMEDYTDSAFRQIVRKIAPNVPVFTEFISVDGLKYNPEKVSKKYSHTDAEYPLIVQLFGGDPAHFVHAIEMLKDCNLAGIDINMGCPAHRVVKCQYGAALLQHPENAYAIAEACVKASPFPVSVKTRLGWDNKRQILDFAKGFEDVGVEVISIHGRTYKQSFSGQADWEPIYELKDSLKYMKVIGNGDVNSGQFALDKIGNLDGVMVGHHSFGNPWLLEEVYQSLRIGEPVSLRPPFEEIAPWILKHMRLSVELKGEHYGVREMRKQLGAYVKELPGSREVRSKLVRVNKEKEVKEILEEFLGKSL